MDAWESTPRVAFLSPEPNLVFGERHAVSTDDIIKGLTEMDEAPWADLKGGPINTLRLAYFLKPYGVQRHQVRIGAWTGKGYRAETSTTLGLATYRWDYLLRNRKHRKQRHERERSHGAEQCRGCCGN
jgi:hypothetical protein